MMLSFTSGTILVGMPGQSAAAQDLGPIRTVFIASVIFNSYLIGIVAGKISDESVASGFKHASILVIIALLASKLMPLFIKL
jgi:flagellar protein FlaJ